MIGHADRASPLRDYCLGLIMPCERKSVEPMAAVTAPDRTAAQHQSLLHLISARALTYVAGILPNTTVWTPGTGPLPPKKWAGCGQRPKRLRRDDEHKPISVEELALGLPKRSWRRIKWREGTAEHLSSRFARLRVCVAHRDYALTESRPEEWLLIEWPKVRKSRPNIGFRPCRKTSPSANWWSSLNSVGVSSAIIRSSNKRSGSDISKGEAGAVFTTTPRCALPPTDFWSPRGRGFPPQDLATPLGSKNLPFPKVIDPEAPPPRTERHVPNSIATMRRRLIIALVSTLSRCPCCATPLGKGTRRKKL